ncbi:MAG: hypothetical protein ACYCS8_05080 [Acidithiobacillus sp.]|uniref:hypothetical protein n=1 Tax=Acidithiobacillus ferrooxidans TaxID=920 RepID=UPI000A82440D|nr:hypothetical protein [Acidithiobacillus ferrooxidans]
MNWIFAWWMTLPLYYGYDWLVRGRDTVDFFDFTNALWGKTQTPGVGASASDRQRLALNKTAQAYYLDLYGDQQLSAPLRFLRLALIGIATLLAAILLLWFVAHHINPTRIPLPTLWRQWLLYGSLCAYALAALLLSATLALQSHNAGAVRFQQRRLFCLRQHLGDQKQRREYSQSVVRMFGQVPIAPPYLAPNQKNALPWIAFQMVSKSAILAVPTVLITLQSVHRLSASVLVLFAVITLFLLPFPLIATAARTFSWNGYGYRTPAFPVAILCADIIAAS